MLFTLNHSGGYVEVLILVLICASEMTDGLEHFFICIHMYCRHSYWEMTIQTCVLTELWSYFHF